VPTTSGREDVTALLAAWQAGSPGADDRLLGAVQRELRVLASSHLRRERAGHTLQATALVHEAYLRLVRQDRVSWQSRAHFFGIAAQMMRRVLVDYARRRHAAKRPDGEPMTLSGVPDAAGPDPIDVLALHEALEALGALDARQAHIVELRYFGGLTIEEIAEAAAIAPATVKRDLATARLWLRHAMEERRAGG
jgi:RNA polymerase sigma factor (TIGR02999 family)